MFEQDVLSDRSESAHLVTEPTWWGTRPREIRWQADLARLLADPVWRGVDLTRGDGEPMLLIPGFLAGDQSLSVMASRLRKLGYRPRRAGRAFNVACSDIAFDRLKKVLAHARLSSGRKVAIVGHSRSGHFARALTAGHPERVSLTSIYSQGDGVVRWRACVVPYARNVEVTGSHIGLAFNRHAYRENAHTLAPSA